MQHVSLKAATWMATQNEGREPVPEDILSPGDIETVRRDLHRGDWLGAGRPGGGSMSGDNPMAIGRAGVEHFSSPRSVKKYRSREAQIRILEYLEDNPYSSSVEEMIGVANQDFTGEITQDDLVKAEKQLADLDMVKGSRSFGVGYLLRPEITPKGQRCLDSGVAPIDFVEGSDVPIVDNSQNVHLGGSQNTVQIGDHNTQNIQQNASSVNMDEALEILSEIKELVRGQSSDDGSSIEALEVLVNAENPNPSLIKSMIEATAGSFAQTAGSQAAQRLGMLGTQLLSSLGA